mmetsp:Transcript_17936/g.41830  ORF Transcript_17936/g.41830 Transcript_17936/m.41830 type:complete len:240 (-) Transcript_17936:151-870(-)
MATTPSVPTLLRSVLRPRRLAPRGSLLLLALCTALFSAGGLVWLLPADSPAPPRGESGPAPSDPSRRRLLAAATVAGTAVLGDEAAIAKRPEGVNNPNLLPKSDGAQTPVIDVIKLLGGSQKREIEANIRRLQEGPNGIKLRVLCQTFPNTPGLAIRDYWNVDDNTLIYVHDTGGLGPSLVVNFQAGKNVEALKPLSFWRQVQNRYQNRFDLQARGDADTVVAVVQELTDSLLPQAVSA